MKSYLEEHKEKSESGFEYLEVRQMLVLPYA